jgi:hypothetical protein
MLAYLLRRRSCRNDQRVGNPHDTDQWEWSCGFYPGSEPGEISADTGATFEEARADFEAAWQVFLPKRTEADFQACEIREIGPRGIRAVGCRQAA